MQPYNCPHTPCGIHTPYSMWGSITGCSPTSPHIPPTGSTPRSAPIGCGDYYGMQPHLPCRTWRSASRSCRRSSTASSPNVSPEGGGGRGKFWAETTPKRFILRPGTKTSIPGLRFWGSNMNFGGVLFLAADKDLRTKGFSVESCRSMVNLMDVSFLFWGNSSHFAHFPLIWGFFPFLFLGAFSPLLGGVFFHQYLGLFGCFGVYYLLFWGRFFLLCYFGAYFGVFGVWFWGFFSGFAFFCLFGGL